MPAGVRAMGLGGSYVAVADDASATQWNPAGLNQMPEKEVQFMRAQLFAEQNQQSVGYAHPHWRNRDRETWGVSATLLDVDPFDVTEEGQALGSARPLEWVAGLSYARAFRNIFWGTTAKFVQAKTYNQTGQTYAMDLGVMGFGPTPQWTWGATASNVGPPLKLGSQSIDLPVVFRMGPAWRKPRLGPGDLLATGQIDLPIDDRIGGRLGVEYAVPFSAGWRAALRAGFQKVGNPLYSMGFGVATKSMGLNYTFTSHGEVGDAGYMDICFRFGGPLKPEVERRRLLEVGRTSLAEGDMVRAREVWDRLSVLSPKHPPVRQMGRTLEVRMLESMDPQTIFSQGKKAFEENKFTQAADIFRKLLLVDPEFLEGRAWLEKCEKRIEADRLARLKAEIAVGREREYRSLARQAASYESQNRWEEALVVWKRAKVRHPNSIPVTARLQACQENLYIQAETALKTGNEEKAMALFLTVDRGGSYRDANRRAKEIEKEIAQENTKRGQAKYREGRDAYVKGNLPDARRFFEEALQLNPQSKEIRQALNRVLEELKFSQTNHP